jgi:hypothetical protein
MSSEELAVLREFNKEKFGLDAEVVKEMKIPTISVLSMILSMQGTPLGKLKQLYDLKEKLHKKIKIDD